jgi:V/A-type H+-transporting ATPase subunit E
MEGAERIIEKINEDSKGKAENILAEAREEAEKIFRDATGEAERRKKEIIEDGERMASLRKQRIISEARIRTRRMEWNSREELINEVLSEARRKIAEKKGKKIINALIEEAAIAAGGGDLEVLISEDDAKYITQKDISKTSKKLSNEFGKASLLMSDERLTGLGGPIVRTSDGKIVVNNTFDRRIEILTGELRSKIVEELFG